MLAGIAAFFLLAALTIRREVAESTATLRGQGMTTTLPAVSPASNTR